MQKPWPHERLQPHHPPYCGFRYNAKSKFDSFRIKLSETSMSTVIRLYEKQPVQPTV